MADDRKMMTDLSEAVRKSNLGPMTKIALGRLIDDAFSDENRSLARLRIKLDSYLSEDEAVKRFMTAFNDRSYELEDQYTKVWRNDRGQMHNRTVNADGLLCPARICGNIVEWRIDGQLVSKMSPSVVQPCRIGSNSKSYLIGKLTITVSANGIVATDDHFGRVERQKDGFEIRNSTESGQYKLADGPSITLVKR